MAAALLSTFSITSYLLLLLEKSKVEQVFETLISSLDNSWMPNNKPMNKPPTQYQPKSTNFDERIVLTDPRTEAEEYQFSNKKFESDVASSVISHQDLQMSPVIGFHSMSKDEKQEKSGPRFDIKTMRRTMTAINGKSVELSCSVIDLGNKTVSWIRKESLHIISAGHYTYTSDPRFYAKHQLNSSEWNLRIQKTKKSDEGRYECQLSTQPVKSFFIDLKVVVPIATILGSPEIYLDVGSTINLTCIIKHTPMPPADVQWKHNQKIIDYTSVRGGVSVLTNKAEITTSYLIIQKAQIEDGGIYSCENGVVDPAKVKVHVLTGDNLRGLHTNTASKENSRLTSLYYSFLFLYHIMIYYHINKISICIF